ncbi:MAG: C4-type zinc ribbon domain-containing protein, partial [Anaerolineales bacterium]|nr:C4-type zinc ribbon domain-containing protein [Anaerolineales bacterium]
SERTTLESELGFEGKTLANDIENLYSEREVALNSIPAELLRKYDTAKLKYRGVAVALVKDGTCSCCGLGVSTGHIQAARSGNNIVTCDNCNRFLYVK